jgi:hypothetical protein
VDSKASQGGLVFTVGPLNVAYRDGETATVYVRFPTEEDSKLLFQVAVLFIPVAFQVLTIMQQEGNSWPLSGICGGMSSTLRINRGIPEARAIEHAPSLHQPCGHSVQSFSARYGRL